VRYDDIADGSSQTIFLGEKLMDQADLGWISGTKSTLRNTGLTPNRDRRRFGRGPAVIDEDDEDAAATKGAAAGPSLVVGGYSSVHSGGANFAFGDGSVRFLRDSISPNVYHCLGNRADGEMIDAARF
jgi:prepilin-type processing-associated H-X9-DG protein